MAVSCGDWSTHVRWCPPLSASIVTQLVTRPLEHQIRRDLHDHATPGQRAADLPKWRSLVRAALRPYAPP
jgi:hypothetical protein